MAFSQFFATEIAEYLGENNQQLPIPPTNIYLALHTSEPDSSNVAASELVGLGYQRTEVIFTVNAPSNQEVNLTNNNTVVFPTALGTAPQITHYSIWSQTAFGEAYAFGPWNSPASWIVGSTFTVPIGQLVIPLITRVVTIT